MKANLIMYLVTFIIQGTMFSRKGHVYHYNIISKIITNILQVISELQLYYQEQDLISDERHDRLKANAEKLDEMALRLKILSIMYMDKYKTAQKPLTGLPCDNIIQSVSLN